MGTKCIDREADSKVTFYSWKQVMRDPHSLKESIVSQSDDLFHVRSECVKDAKRKFEDDSGATKRIIVKKNRTLPVCIDEVDRTNMVTHIERLLTLCYSLEVAKCIQRLSLELCFGCMFDEEQDHTCQILSEHDQVSKYFNAAMNEVNEDRVLDHWFKLLDNDSSLKPVSTFDLVPYQCKDYRDTHFKTDQWLTDLKPLVVNILILEKRFQ